MPNDYSVVTSRRYDGYSFEDALAFARTMRALGYGANVYKRDEALELFVNGQQDLTELVNHG